MNLFIFFVLPFATILLAVVLQKILKSPTLVAITFFAIYLIVAFVFFSDTLAEAIIAAIIYTIIAYLIAYIVMIFSRVKHRFCNYRKQGTEGEERCSCNNNENRANAFDDNTKLDLNYDATTNMNENSITNLVKNNRIPNYRRRCYRRI